MMSKVVTRRILALALCLSPIALPSANDDGVESCSEGVVSRLYMGQNTPVGAVTELQWRAFVAESVTPRFPAGFTELQAQGHWRDDRGTTIEEGTRIVEIVHDGERLSRERVREVAADYKHRFAQQSILITQAQSFHCF
jgi:Protein of unknown function (DUF3574)